MTALASLASMGDFERFSNGLSVSYFGLTPKRSDSGEKTGRNEKITKAGDTLCRMLLTEGICGSIGGTKTNVKKLKKGQVVSPQVEAEARKCNARNRARYEHLVAVDKHANVAKIAVASELIRDMWIIGRMVQREMAKQKG